MKQYWEIQGPSKAPREYCYAFNKLDGSNIRAEWNKKRGWHKFGSRHVLLDESHPVLGTAIHIFLETYGENLISVFTSHKMFHGCQSMVAFFEFFGSNSFAGWHDDTDKKEVVFFDVNIHKRGILSPRDFLKAFGHLKIPEIVYEGNFNASFIQDVKDGKYPVEEGVVAKGLLPKGKPPHNLWMAKVKTSAWIEKLKQKSQEQPEIWGKELQDNVEEQT
jgi:hypothetical protein